jgi:hypothetical protein
MLKRAKSDYGPSRVTFDHSVVGEEEEDFAMRHGWQEEYTSSEYLKILHSVRSELSDFHLNPELIKRASELLYVFHGETSRDQWYPQGPRW